MSKLLVIFALVVGIAMFTLVNTEEASAMNKAELVDAISSDAGLSKACTRWFRGRNRDGSAKR